MPIDPSSFHLQNITDTCAVWNVLSSRTLYSAARGAGVMFICTGYVLYECLYKPRKVASPHDDELKARLRSARMHSSFSSYPLDVGDLQAVEILENRKRLGKGELSSIAFASKTRQAFLTDDQKASKLAREVLEESPTQTTPHLASWLFFGNRLGDADKEIIIKEHQQVGRHLGRLFEDAYLEACRCRLMASQGAGAK